MSTGAVVYMPRFPVGSIVPTNTGEEGHVLIVTFWNPVRGFGFAKDQAANEHFLSASCLRTIKDGEKAPKFADKQPVEIRRGDEIVAVVKSAEVEGKKPFCIVWGRLDAYTKAADAIESLELFQVVTKVRQTGQPTEFIVFGEARHPETLATMHGKLTKSLGDNAGSPLRKIAGFRRKNEHGDWVECASPLVEAKAQPAEAKVQPTRKAGRSKGQPITPSAKQASRPRDRKLGKGGNGKSKAAA